jgi:hypothetical protein
MCWTEALAASTKFLKSLTGEEGRREGVRVLAL